MSNRSTLCASLPFSPVSFPPHSLVNDIRCASLNAKLLQVTLLRSLHCWITYNLFLTSVCCLTFTFLNSAVELLKFNSQGLWKERIINWVLAFKRFVKPAWMHFCIRLEFAYFCQKSRQCIDAEARQAGIHFSLSTNRLSLSLIFHVCLSRKKRNLEHIGWLWWK